MEGEWEARRQEAWQFRVIEIIFLISLGALTITYRISSVKGILQKLSETSVKSYTVLSYIFLFKKFMFQLVGISSQRMNTTHVLCIEPLTPCLVQLALTQELENLSSAPLWVPVNKEVTISLWGDVSPPVIRSMLMHWSALHL